MSTESKQSKSPRTKLQIASDAIMYYNAHKDRIDEQRYIMIGYEAEIDQLDKDAISIRVCENVRALVKAMLDEPVHVRTEVLKVLPDGRTERLSEPPQLNIGGES
jgi:hypothetical protein